MQNYPPVKYMKIFNRVAKTQKEKTLVRNAAYFYTNKQKSQILSMMIHR